MCARKNVYPAVLGCNALKISINALGLMCHLRPPFFVEFLERKNVLKVHLLNIIFLKLFGESLNNFCIQICFEKVPKF